MSAIGLVLLAAGASTRMGTAKQRLPYRGRTLLRHAAETALASSCRPVVVVLGANGEQLRPELEGLLVCLVKNPDWERGMASSIRAGIAALENSGSDVEAAILMLTDQPLLSPDTLHRLVTAYSATRRNLVVSDYGGILGAPALFSRSLFPELLRLEGAEGAKPVIQKYRSEAAAVPCPEGAIDIDTPDDYRRLCDLAGRQPSETGTIAV